MVSRTILWDEDTDDVCSENKSSMFGMEYNIIFIDIFSRPIARIHSHNVSETLSCIVIAFFRSHLSSFDFHRINFWLILLFLSIFLVDELYLKK